MSSPIDAVEQVLDLLPAVVGADWLTLTDDQVITLVARLGSVRRLAEAAAALGAGEIDDRSRRELGTGGLAYRHGQRSASALISELTFNFQAESAAQVRLGRAIRNSTTLHGEVLSPHRPHIAAALTAGGIDPAAASVIVRCITQAETRNAALDDIDAAEQAMVRYAATNPAELVAIHARVWRDALDPDGVRPRENETRERRGAYLSREKDGMSRLTVDCDTILAALLREVFSVAGSPRKDPVFLDETEMSTDPDLSDPRTRAQRNHDVISGLIDAGLRVEGRKTGKLRAPITVVATISLTDLLHGTGHGYLDGTDEPLSVEAIQELARTGGFQPLIHSRHGEPLFLGRTERYFTDDITLAATIRDGGCVWPSYCPVPASGCDAHHIQEWENDHGPTDIDNCVLLCPFHHHMLHNTDYTLRMIHGRPFVQPPATIDPHRQWRPLGRSRALPVGTDST